MDAVFYLMLVLHSCAFLLALELPRGVILPEAALYTPGKSFTCRNGIGKISWDKVNDDYCDCIDGSDEPGTSACSNGVFYCRDLSYKTASIHSSLVNDGICDCCDGSDEYNGITNCQSTCGALAAAVVEARSLKRVEIEEGRRKYKEFIKMLPTIMEEKRVQAEKAEQERLALEANMLKQEGLRVAEEAERLRKEEEERKQHREQEGTPPQEDKIELTGEKGTQPEWQETQQDEGHPQSQASPDDSGRIERHAAPADNTLISGEEDQDGSNHGQSDEASHTAAPQETTAPTINYGPGEGFRMLAYLEECLKLSDREYTYELCPFKDVSQHSASQSHGTSLGRWGRWESEGGNNYSVMMYTGGDGCWNGPSRSTKVYIHCGSENQLFSASEPSRCEYLMHLRTPAACYDEPEEILARLHGDQT